MKKTIIGLNLKWFPAALVASFVGGLGLFLPYASVRGANLSYLDLLGKYQGTGILVFIAVVFSVVTTVCGCINFLHPSKLGMRLMAVTGDRKSVV